MGRYKVFLRSGRWFVLGVCLTLLASCSVGPQNIKTDRFDYGESISNSWKKETLLNIVKLRYADTPVFLEVSQVINQYSYETQVDVGANFLSGSDLDTQNIGATGRYYDRPTITYTPLIGDRFTRAILTPVRPGSILFLAQAGWNVKWVMRLSVAQINGINNSASSPKFELLTDALRRIQVAGALALKSNVDDLTSHSLNMIFIDHDDIKETVREDIRYVKQLLKLAPDSNEFLLRYGTYTGESNVLNVMTRSALEMLIALAKEIDVPAQHIDEGRTIGIVDNTRDTDNYLVRINSSNDRPKNAFVDVPYQGHWFYVDNTDFQSKRTFTFVKILLSLAENGVERGGAVVTVGAGG